MSRRNVFVLLLLFVLLFETCSHLHASVVVPKSSDGFVDTLGVNTHLSYVTKVWEMLGTSDHLWRTIDYFKNLTLLQGGYSKPIITTETGWQSLPAHVIYWVPEIVQARYTLRSLVLQFTRGISKTYLYEMCDDSEFFGLLNYNSTDNVNPPSPKPVYRALKGMIQVLSESPRLPQFSLKELTFGLTTNETKNSNLQKVWLQKSNGNQYLLVWQEVYSHDKGVYLNIAPVLVNLNVSMQISRVSKYTFGLDGNMSNESLSFSNNITLQATDTMTIVEIVPKSSSPVTPTASNSGFVPQKSTITPQQSKSNSTQPGNSRLSSSNQLFTLSTLLLIVIISALLTCF